MIVFVFEFGWFGFGLPRSGTLSGVCIGPVRFSLGFGTLAQAIQKRIRKGDGS